MKSIAWFLIVLLLGGIGAGCNRKKASDTRGANAFHSYLQDDIKSLDPANAYDTLSTEVLGNIQEALYEYDYLSEEYKLVPLLAADVPTYSKDRLTVTIPIKKGVHFQDDPCFKQSQGKGREVTAHDFVYAFKRIADPALQSQGWWIFDGKIVGINAFRDKLAKTPKSELGKIFAEPVEGIRALDASTLQIKLLKPYPQLLYVLAMTFASPVAHEAVEAYGDENGNLTDHPVGTGPFVLKSWDRGRRVELVRNPTVHPEFYPTEGSLQFRKKGLLEDAGKSLPLVDQVTFDIIKERQPAWLNFMQGNLDLLTLSKDNFGQAISQNSNISPELAAKGIRLEIDIGAVIYYLNFNVQDKILKNKYLRQAISSAINREKWIDTFNNGTSLKMVNAVPPGIIDRPKTDKIKYDFNLERAKALLKRAGYPDGKGLPALNFDLRGADTLNRQLGEFFTQQLAQIGVQLNVIYNTFPAFLEKAKQGNLQISYGGWNLDYPDPENIYQLFYGPNKEPGPNDANMDDSAFNKMYEQLAIMDPGPKRAQLIQKMDDLIQEECPWAYGIYWANYQLTQPWVQNFRGGEIITNKFKYFKVRPDVKKRYLEK